MTFLKAACIKCRTFANQCATLPIQASPTCHTRSIVIVMKHSLLGHMVHYLVLECVVHDFDCVTTPINEMYCTMLGLSPLLFLFSLSVSHYTMRECVLLCDEGCDQILTTPLCNPLMSLEIISVDSSMGSTWTCQALN